MNVLIRNLHNCLAVIAILPLAFLSCNKGNLPPVARLTAFPPVGDSLTLFEFRAGGSTDDRNYPIGLLCRWDTNADGQWDTEYDPGKTISHQFPTPGLHVVAVEVRDLDGLTSVARDTVEVMGMNRDIGTLTDDRDGNRYRIVKIRDRWWMAENLRYGEEIPVSRLQTDNGIVEMYRNAGSHSLDSSAGVYQWLEAMDYQVRDPKGICPNNWHIPTHQEWDALFAPFPILYALQYYGKAGLSNLNLDLQNGATRWTDGTFWWAFERGYDSEFWSSSYEVRDNVYHPYCILFMTPYGGTGANPFVNNILQGSENAMYFSIRCIQDRQ